MYRKSFPAYSRMIRKFAATFVPMTKLSISKKPHEKDIFGILAVRFELSR